MLSSFNIFIYEVLLIKEFHQYTTIDNAYLLTINVNLHLLLLRSISSIFLLDSGIAKYIKYAVMCFLCLEILGFF